MDRPKSDKLGVYTVKPGLGSQYHALPNGRFLSGADVLPLSLFVASDAVAEPDETFSVRFTPTRVTNAGDLELADFETFTFPFVIRGQLPKVSIAQDGDVTAGTAATFTLTRTGDVSGTLRVNVSVSETGTAVESTHEGTQQVDFEEDEATATLEVPTTGTGASVVTATLAAGAAYQVVSPSEAQVRVGAHDDATLRALSLGDAAALDPAFDAATTTYTAAVANAVEQVTVTATPNAAGATVAYLDATDMPLADAQTDDDGDAATLGHQVALPVGDTVIKAQVTAADMTTQAYTVTVTRAAQNLPVVSIAAASSGTVTEGDAAEFTLTRTGSTVGVLRVDVLVSESGADRVAAAGEGTKEVVFADGDATATLSVDTLKDDVEEADSTVTAALVAAPARYVLGAPASAAVAVEDAFEFSIFVSNTASHANAARLPEPIELEEGVLFQNKYVYTAKWNRAGGSVRYRASVVLDGTAEEADVDRGALSVIDTYTFDLTTSVQTAALPNGRYQRAGFWDPGVHAKTDAVAEPDETFSVRFTPVSVTGTGVELSDFETQTIDFVIAGQLPKVSIAADGDVSAGTDATFTLTRTVSTSEALSVDVSVSETGTAVESTHEGTQQVDFGEDEATATLTVPTTGSAASVVTATLSADAAYQVVSPSEAQVRVGAHDDASLRALTLGDAAALDPAFDAATTTYTASVANAVEQVTVTATPNAAGATVAYLDATDMPLADAAADDENDAATLGHQVALPVGDTVIKVRVTAQDTTTQTYTVTVTRAALVLPTVTIAAPSSGTVTEGDAAEFTLTRTGSTVGVLRVDVSVSEGDFANAGATESGGDRVAVGDEGTREAVFADGSSTATLSVATVLDDVEEAGTMVTAALVAAPARYVLGSPASASVDAWDVLDYRIVVTDDQSNTSLAEIVTQRPIELAEGDTFTSNHAIRVLFNRFGPDVTYAASLVLEGSAESGDVTLAAFASGGTYIPRRISAPLAQDYHALPNGRFLSGAGAFPLTLIAVSDAVAEPDETFSVRFTPTRVTNAGDLELADFETFTFPFVIRGQLPKVSIAQDGDVTAGTAATFTLTRTGDVSGTLRVNVSVSETGTAAESTHEGTQQVDFGEDEATATLEVPTTGTGASVVTATLAAGAAYQVVSPSEAQVRVGAHDDATLRALSLGDAAALDPAFDAATTTYTAAVANAVEQVTVTATPNAAGATVAYLDATDMPLADAQTDDDGDAATLGHQVALPVGDTVIKAQVTAADMTTQAYTVTVTRAAQNLPVVSIAAASSGTVTEGDAAEFTLTRTGSTVGVLRVDVLVSESGADRVAAAGEGTKEVVFADGDATATLSVDTLKDDVEEADSTVTAALVAAPARYVLGAPASAAVAVEDAFEFSIFVSNTASHANAARLPEPIELEEGVLFQNKYVYTAKWNRAGGSVRYRASVVLDGTAEEADVDRGALSVIDTYTFDLTTSVQTAALPNGRYQRAGFWDPGVHAKTDAVAEPDETFSVRFTPVSVTGTGVELSDFETQTIDFVIAGQLPKVSIAADGDVSAGTDATFTLTRTVSTSEALSVDVSVSETGTAVESTHEGTQQVDFGEDEATATLTVPTTGSAASVVTATLSADAAYQVVSPSEAQVRVGAHDDASLRALTLGDAAALDPAFDAATTTYTASVANAVEQVTVTATPNAAGATVAYLDATDMPLADAAADDENDAATLGHQVALPVGDTVIKVRVTAQDTTTQTYTVTVTRAAANAAPTAASNTVTTRTDIDYKFTAGDFQFSDTDVGDALAHVKIESVPGKGTLELSGSTVSAGDTVTKTLLDAGDLVYAPPSGESGDAFTSFEFRVNDGTEDSTASYIMTINVSDDLTAPTVSGTPTATKKALIITFSETLDEDAVPPAGAFRVMAMLDGGAPESLDLASGREVTVSGATVTLPLDVALIASDTGVTVAYTQPSAADDRLKDVAGNEVATFAARSVNNTSPACPLASGDNVLFARCVTVGTWTAGNDTVSGYDGGTSGRGSITTNAKAAFGGESYTVYGLQDAGSTTEVSLRPDATQSAADERKRWGDVAWNIDGVAVGSPASIDGGSETQFRWSGTSFDWEAGDRISLYLQEAASGAQLSGLALNEGTDDPGDMTDFAEVTLSPTFAAATLTYTASVGSDVRRVTVTPAPGNAFATAGYVDGDGMAIPDAVPDVSGDTPTLGRQVDLDTGDNVINVTVKSPGGVHEHVYQVTVTRALSADATLSALSLGDAVTLEPAFAAATTTYTASVPNAVEQVTVTATPNSAGATVAYLGGDDMPLADAVADVEGDDATQGHQVALPVGDTVIKVKVTAQDMTTRTYTVTVTRNVLPTVSIASDGDVSAGSEAAFTLTRTGSTSGTLRVNVSVSETGTAVASDDEGTKEVAFKDGEATAPLEVPTTGSAASVVTATLSADTPATYEVGTPSEAEVRVGAHDDATLRALSLGDGVTLEPAFAAATTTYTASVANAVEQVTVTATPNSAGATVAYLGGDDMPLADAVADVEGDDATQGHQVALPVGDTVIKVKVTAQDMTTRTYTVTVTRNVLPTVSIASDGDVSAGSEAAFTLTRTGSTSGTLRVNVSVSETGTAVASDDEGTKEVAFKDGEATAPLEVPTTGSAASVVTATLSADTPATYEVGTPSEAEVRVGAHDDATLRALSLGDGVTLEPAFAAATTTYTASVANAVEQVTVTATPNSAGATVAYLGGDDMPLADAVADVEGDDATQGHQVALPVGDTVIKAKVTAQDMTEKTYSVTVTRNVLPTVSIASDGDVSAGSEAVFTLTRTGSTSGVLRVNVSVSETGTAVESDNEGTKEVDFGDGEATAPLTVPTTGSAASVVTATLAADTPATYEVGTPGSAEVRVGAHDDASLRALSLGDGVTLEPAFAAATTTYSASVPNAVEQVTVTATPNSAGATVALLGGDDMPLADAVADVEGDDATQGHQVALPVGDTVIKAKVTAQDMTTRTYTVTVTRNVLPTVSIASDGDVSAGTAATFTLTRTGSTSGVLRVNVSVSETGTAVESDNEGTKEVDFGDGEATAPLTVPTTGSAASVVTATLSADTPATYEVGTPASAEVRVGAHDDASLRALSLGDGVTLEPAFAAATTTYSASVPNAVEQVTVTATPNSAGATVALLGGDDMPLADAVADVEGDDATQGHQIALPVGDTVIKAKVTAQDMTTRTYTVTVTRNVLPAVAIASDGDVSAGTAATFTLTRTGSTSGTLRVNVSVSETGTAVESDNEGTKQVAFGDGEATAPLEVPTSGSAASVVTATLSADTPATYEVGTPSEAAVRVGAHDDATLRALSLGDGVTLEPAFAAATTTYSASVPNAVEQVTVTATPNSAGATVALLGGDDMPLADAVADVEGDAATLGHQVALGVGDTVIKVKVTAQDMTEKTYSVTVTRAAARLAETPADVFAEGVMTVGTGIVSGSTMHGYHAAGDIGAYESFSGTIGLATLAFDAQADLLHVAFASNLDAGRYLLHAGYRSFAVAVEAPASAFTFAASYVFPNDSLLWSDGRKVPVRLVGAAGDEHAYETYNAALKPGNARIDATWVSRVHYAFMYRIQWQEAERPWHTWKSHGGTGFVRSHYGKNNGYAIGADTAACTGIPNAAQWRPFAEGESWEERESAWDAADKACGSALANGTEYKVRIRYFHDRHLARLRGPWSDEYRATPTASGQQKAALPALSVGKAIALEAEGAALNFPVTLSRQAAREVTVEYATSDGTATVGKDYEAASGTLRFAPGETAKTVPVTVLVDDDRAEGPETLTLTLSNPSANARIEDGTATGTIEETDLRRSAPLTASFEGLPAEHDGNPFTFTLRFSENVGLSYVTLQDALSVTGGEVTGVRRSDPDAAERNRSWEITVAPFGPGDIALTLPADALGLSDGRQLAGEATALVPGERRASPAPVAASYPSSPYQSYRHKGPDDRPQVVVAFDRAVEAIAADSPSVSVSGGRLSSVSRHREAGIDNAWMFFLAPAGHGDVTFTLLAEVPCNAGGICAADGGMLTRVPGARTIPGLPVLDVADARVEEGDGAVLEFAVTLSRQTGHTVTVQYATADGTATAESDYTAASGTLTLSPRQSAATVSVAVLDDDHDEGSETLTLRLSKPTNARIGDGEATGTIDNDDPLPGAWLARFGRAVGNQVLEAAARRFEGGASSPHLTVGGISLGREAPLAADPLAPAGWLVRRPAPGNEPRQPEERTLSGRELLLGSSFHLVSDSEEGGRGPALSAWGRIATSGFQAEVDEVSLDGEVTTGFLGFDAEWERLLAGLLLSHSEGDGGYRGAADEGRIESRLTGVYPYARLTLSGRVSLWGVAGAGSGDLALIRRDEVIDTALGLRLGAVGVTGKLLAGNPLDLALRSDALWVRTDSDAAEGLAASSAQVSRVRLVLEGGRELSLAAGSTLAPTLQVGVRHDGGDAETGLGLEVGAGIRYAVGMLSVEARARVLLAHEAAGYEEWGAGGAIRLSPGASGLGPSLAVMPSWGTPESGAERLWSQAGASSLARRGAAAAAGRLDAELGYGLAALRGRGILTPYARVALADGVGRSWHLGTRLTVAESLDLSLEGSQRQGADRETAHDVALRATVPW